MLVYESYYQIHKVLEGKRSSQRLAAGTGGFVPEPVATLNHIKFAGTELSSMPAAFIPASLTPGVPSSISGDGSMSFTQGTKDEAYPMTHRLG